MRMERPPARSRWPRRWPQVTVFLLLFITSSLIHGASPQDCDATNYLCPYGYCCNVNYVCGNATADCSTNCSSQCSGESGVKCGPNFLNNPCPDGSCCSTFGWCGWTNSWCGAGNCSSQCPSGLCGANGGKCPDGDCCNYNGYCGNTTGYCGAGNCQSQCPPLPAPSPSPIPAPSPSPIPDNRESRTNRGTNRLSIIVGLSTGIPAFLIACSVMALFLWGKYGGGGPLGTMFTKEDPTIQLEGMPERFSYRQLSVATRAFSPESKLGQGGFGSVYRGMMPSSGVAVAVKKINSDSRQGEKEFMAEVSIISQLRHRNLIQLHGWCRDAARGKFLLVYELMPNGSLDKALYLPQCDGETGTCLSWTQRFNIVTGTAAAVNYLHQGWRQQVIHRDIKASNIMLDQNWNAKLGDFGLARLVDHQRAAPTTGVAGTYGYIAPEAAITGRFTDKTDVFAFGAVVLEVACGRSAFSVGFPPEEIVLVDWVWRRLSEDDLLSAVDKRLEGNYDADLMEMMLIVGLLCSHPDAQARPSMQLVVEVLAGHVPVPVIPASKPALVFSSGSQDFFLKSSRHSNSGSKSGSTEKSKSGSVSLVSMPTTDSNGSASTVK